MLGLSGKLGQMLQIRMPAVAVSIGLKGPLAGVSGLGSNVSMWLGPPFSQINTHRLAFGLAVGRGQPPRDPGTDTSPSVPASPLMRSSGRGGKQATT